MMTYPEALDYLYSALPQFQLIGASAYNPSLSKAIALDNHLNNPHTSYRTIHIAGTNGKGSTSAMIYAVLRAAGFRVGLFTSPHLKDFRERIVVNDQMITLDAVARFVTDNKAILDSEKPSFFELTSTLAFDYFRSEKVDIAVIEVGMGGRLDSTNIIAPILSVVTNIDYDHVQFLGETLAKIAGEKAGIFKPEVPIVVGESSAQAAPVFIARAHELNSTVLFADKCYVAKHSVKEAGSYAVRSLLEDEIFEIRMPLGGDYQQRNLCTALAALDLLSESLGLNEQIVRAGLAEARIRGRWEVLGREPLMICDTAHNIAGMRYVVEQLGQQRYGRLFFVLGMVGDKDVSAVMELLPRDAYYLFTQASIARAMPCEKLARIGADFGLQGEIVPSVAQALERARVLAGAGDMVFIGGSTFTVAEVL